MSQVAVDHADLATILALCCLVDDRTPQEQATLERVAARLDTTRNRTASSNTRYAWHTTKTPCTYSTTHPASDRRAKTGGELDHRCPCDGTRLTPPFTDTARAEELVDQWGWSRALDAAQDR